MMVAMIIYKMIQGIRYAKKAAGSMVNPRDELNGVNGMSVNSKHPSMVMIETGNDARLWMNGNLGVLII